MKKYISIIMYILILYVATSHCQEKLKLYAIYTPSHECLKNDFFLPSLQDDFTVIFKLHKQTCKSAQFMTRGWTQTTIQKVNLIIEAIQENWDNIFIFSDVDIQFFGPIEETIRSLMEGKDMIIQKNSPDGVLCSGFFACRGNKKTLELWKDVKKEMKKDLQCSDQKSLNRCIRRSAHKNIIWDYLPDNFFGGGTLTGRYWQPNMQLPIPHDIIMHHANWTRGISNKILQLEYVRDVVKQNSM